MELLVQFLPAFGIIALLFVFIKNAWVSKQEVGEDTPETLEKMQRNIENVALDALEKRKKIIEFIRNQIKG